MSTGTWIVLGVGVAGIALLAFLLTQREQIVTPLGDSVSQGRSVLESIMDAADVDQETAETAGDVGNFFGGILSRPGM